MKQQIDLTPRELAVMQTFWDKGMMTAEDARVELAERGERLSYPTVANVVRSLAEKNCLRATNDHRPFTYRPTRSFEAVARRIVGELISRLFAGSREEMLVNLLDRRKLTSREKDYLNKILEQQED